MNILVFEKLVKSYLMKTDAELIPKELIAAVYTIYYTKQSTLFKISLY